MLEDYKENLKRIPGVVTLVQYLREGASASRSPRGWIIDNIPKQSIGIEIGVYEGDFSSQILQRKNPRKLHLVDPWEYVPEYEDAWYGGSDTTQKEMDEKYEKVKRDFDEYIKKGIVEVHRKTSSNAVSTFDDSSIDWVYIDGNHLYEYVLRDLINYHSKMKDDGLIMGDDYDLEGWWNNGVKKAVDEFVEDKELGLHVRGDQFIIKSD